MDEDAPYLVYAVTFKNYSSKQICVTPTNSTAATAGVTMTENKNGLSSIASGSSKTYKLILQVTNVLIELNEKPIRVSFTMEQTEEEPAPSSESYFLFDETTGQITGMNTETYTAATAPETLTIPATINGVEVKSLKAGTSSSSAFKLQSNTKNLVIEAAVDKIPDYCFRSCTSLTSITLPSSVTSIREYAFNSCKSLTSITLPSSVTSIDNSAFDDCLSLMITVDEANAYYSSLGGSLYDKNKAALIRGAGKVVVNDIPNGVTSIGYYAFYHCTSLTSITIPSGVTSIGERVFAECSSLTSITIPSSVTSIGREAFGFCSSLMITVDEGNANYSSLGGSLYDKDKTTLIRGAAKAVIDDIPSSVTSIGNDAFGGCTSLTSITIPNGVTSIGYYAFYHCTSLTSITIPSGVTSIGERVFAECSSLTSITIPSSVTKLGRDAFTGIPFLNNISADSNGLKIISASDNSNYKFLIDYTSSLKANITAEMLSDVHVIADGVFHNCTSLTSIEIPNSVTSINHMTFDHCTSLTSIVIPNSVTDIGYQPFYGCASLATVTIDGQDVVNMLTSSSGAGRLLDNSATKTVYIKSGLDMTKATSLTSKFTKQSSSDKAGYDMWTR